MPLFYEDSLGDRIARHLDEFGSADDELIEDPAALEAAQAAVNEKPRRSDETSAGPDWVTVFGPTGMNAALDSPAGWALAATMSLDAAGIAYVWDPIAPEDLSSALGAAVPPQLREFSILVAPSDAARAREALRKAVAGDPGQNPSSPLPASLAGPGAVSVEGGWGMAATLGAIVLAALVFGLLFWAFSIHARLP